MMMIIIFIHHRCVCLILAPVLYNFARRFKHSGGNTDLWEASVVRS